MISQDIRTYPERPRSKIMMVTVAWVPMGGGEEAQPRGGCPCRSGNALVAEAWTLEFEQLYRLHVLQLEREGAKEQVLAAGGGPQGGCPLRSGESL